MSLTHKPDDTVFLLKLLQELSTTSNRGSASFMGMAGPSLHCITQATTQHKADRHRRYNKNEKAKSWKPPVLILPTGQLGPPGMKHVPGRSCFSSLAGSLPCSLYNPHTFPITLLKEPCLFPQLILIQS